MKSFRGFLHGNHLITILTWFVWQGFAPREKSQSQHEMYRVWFVISAEKYAGPFGGIVTVAYLIIIIIIIIILLLLLLLLFNCVQVHTCTIERVCCFLLSVGNVN